MKSDASEADLAGSGRVSVVGVSGTPGQGPFMAIVLRVSTGAIVSARYTTYGCTVAHACGQWLCTAIEGMALSSARLIDEQALTEGVGHMPLGREHCPRLAVSALRHAVDQIEDV